MKVYAWFVSYQMAGPKTQGMGNITLWTAGETVETAKDIQSMEQKICEHDDSNFRKIFGEGYRVCIINYIRLPGEDKEVTDPHPCAPKLRII